MNTNTVYLIRHTTPDFEPGILYGQSDLDVAKSFPEEVQAIRNVVDNHASIPLYCSPLQRCRKLAQALEGTPLNFDDRIKELFIGDWEMKHRDTVDPKALNNWKKNFAHTAPPRGETYAELQKRSVNFWEELETKSYEEVGIVCHYGVIQTLLAHLLHIPLAKAFRFQIDYGAVVKIIMRDGEVFRAKFLK